VRSLLLRRSWQQMPYHTTSARFRSSDKTCSSPESAHGFPLHFPSVLSRQADVLNCSFDTRKPILSFRWALTARQPGSVTGRGHIHRLLRSGNIIVRVTNTISSYTRFRTWARTMWMTWGSEAHRKISKGSGHPMNFLYPLFLLFHSLKTS
jgi:hypothetical protein